MDNQDIPPQDISSFPSSSTFVTNFDLCAWGPGGELTTPSGRNSGNRDNITEGLHTLTVTFRSGVQSLAFDRFMYVPSESKPVGVDQNDLTVELGMWDSAVEYSTGWQDLEGMGRMAASMAAVRIRFYGESRVHQKKRKLFSDSGLNLVF